MSWPEDAVEVGRITDAYGIKGWIKVQPHDAAGVALSSTRVWHVQASERRELHIRALRRQGAFLVAAADELGDRAAAEALRGSAVLVSRASFPSPGLDAYYWVDLIGLSVVNRQGVDLGEVRGLIDTGAHSVLRVAAQAGDERLIPFVAAYIDDVDLPGGRITVDWGLDY